jgi:hypothetical protein
MQKETIKSIKLTADDGMTITNGEAFGKVVYLAYNSSPDNWREITDAEAEELQAEMMSADYT